MLNSPLIEVDAQRKINEIQEKYIEIKKGMDKLNEMNNQPDNKLISELEGYKRLKQLLKKDFDFLDEVIEEFNNNLEGENDIYSTKDYKNIIEKIDRKMYRYISYEEQKKAEMENDKEQGIKIKEFSNNDEMLQRRTNDLIEIKNISAQVAEMSTTIGLEINEQGKKLDTIENNVDETEENTKKAYKEALETEIIMNKSKKKLYCLAALLILLIGFIVFIFSRLY